MTARAVTALLLFAYTNVSAAPAAPDLRTLAEKTGHRETGRYDEVERLLPALSAAAARARDLAIAPVELGRSAEGRPVLGVVVARGGAVTPAAARKAGKRVVLVQAGIHAGEIEGKDAGLRLLRELTEGAHAALLARTVLVFVPVLNVDGHERVSPWNRINQNGPARMGFRTNAQNLNLNRDWIKLDAPETRALVALWNRWDPDFFVDSHTTDGADWPYDLTYAIEQKQNQAPAVAGWIGARFLPAWLAALAKRGHVTAPYLQLRVADDLEKGLEGGVAPPRYSTGYAAARHRPGLLLETHMLKPYAVRVAATYDALVALLAIVDGPDGEALAQAVRSADQATARRTGAEVPLDFALTERAVPFALRVFEATRERSSVSGGTWVRYGTRPGARTVPYFDDVRVTARALVPRAYAVPAAQREVLDVLAAHGIRTEPVAAPRPADVEVFRLSAPRWAEKPFEGRHRLTVTATAAPERVTLEPGRHVLVPLDQPLGDVAMHLLEPGAPDSLLSWGFFDAFLEQKEYGEGYVLEGLARKMLAESPALQKEFDAALRDPAFAKDPEARLDFFYRRSPYWDRQLGRYPVLRIVGP